jgi:hypothetical protein
MLMTPAAIIALVKDALIILAIGAAAWLLVSYGKDIVKVADLKSLQAQILAQGKTLDRWHQESTDANTKLNQTVAAINAAPVVVHDWVRQQPSCPRRPVLPGPAGATGAPGADTGGVQPVGGADADGPRRDQVIAAFKRQWGTELAGCQSILDQWPQP